VIEPTATQPDGSLSDVACDALTAMARLTEELFEKVATRFRALAEPARLRILDALRKGELTVGDLGRQTGLNQANLSKHLQLLHSLDFVVRRKDGVFVYYALKDHDVFRLCDIMCGRLGVGQAAKASSRTPSPPQSSRSRRNVARRRRREGNTRLSTDASIRRPGKTTVAST
jgi:DNA-binding transcriptional ArsR family regulator